VTRRVVVVAAALVLAGFAAPSERFTLGVLRRDGLVMPFATFDRGHWYQDWPAPHRGPDVPITMAAVPSRWWGPGGRRELWQGWTRSAEPIVLHATRPELYDAQCLPAVGLRTDYRSADPLPGRGARPYPKDGLAVSPPHPIERIDIMPIGPVTPPVADAFNGADALAMLDVPPGPLRMLTRDRREAAPITVEAVYAAGSVSARVYYIEAVREYDSNDPDRLGQCDGLSYGAGWFAEDGRGPLRKLSFEVATSSCDRRGLLYMLPLGALRAGDRFFWIAQWSGWNVEQYNIVEIKPRGTQDAVRALGGGC
jgi:hypothetical protein